MWLDDQSHDKPMILKLFRGKTDEHELIACYANHLADQSSSLSYIGRNGRGGGGTDSSPEDAPPHPVHHRRDKPHEKVGQDPFIDPAEK